MSERLSPIEAIMWRAGQDPVLRMTVGNLVLLDRPVSGAALVDRLAAAAQRATRLRSRLDASPVAGRSRWVEDPDFDPDRHVRVMAVPSPGDLRHALDLIGLIEPSPFDGGGSPWDVTIIEGLSGGRGALYLRAHHVLTDGLGGIELLDLLLDESQLAPPEPPPPAEPGTPESLAAEPAAGPADASVGADAATEADGAAGPAADAALAGDGAATRERGRRPGTLTVTVDLTHAARPIASGVASGVAAGVAGVAAARRLDPIGALVRGAQRGLGAASSVAQQVSPPGGPLSPLAPSTATTTRFEVMTVPGARDTALALGGSRNDLLVAAAAAALGSYLERLGLATEELRVAMPTVRHREAGLGGNWFAPTRVEIPASEAHPGPRFGVVSERLARARTEPAVRVATAISPGLSRMPSRALISLLLSQAGSIDLIATALPGLRGERHLVGTTIQASYGFGPRLGRLMNITGLGNDSRLDVGIGLDPNAITQPALLLECLEAAFGSFDPKGTTSSSRPRERSARTPATQA